MKSGGGPLHNGVDEETDGISSDQRGVGEEENEILVVVETDTVVHPWAVVVHLECTCLPERHH